jgi:hypothetical protein
LQAACVVRSVTAPLVAAMVPGVDAAEALERLRALPFVSAGPGGLEVHAVVRDAVAAALKAEDPHRNASTMRPSSRHRDDVTSKAGVRKCGLSGSASTAACSGGSRYCPLARSQVA